MLESEALRFLVQGLAYIIIQDFRALCADTALDQGSGLSIESFSMSTAYEPCSKPRAATRESNVTPHQDSYGSFRK